MQKLMAILRRIQRMNLQIVLMVTTLFLTASAASEQRSISLASGQHDDVVSGEILVKFNPQLTERKINQKLRLKKASVLKKFRITPWYHIKVDPHPPMDQIIASWRKDLDILAVEPNALGKPVRFPNDALFSEKWDLHNTGQKLGSVEDADIDAPEAWEFFQGTRLVKIGVIDTGVDITHPDLADNIWTNPDEIPDNGIDDDGNGYSDDLHGWDFGDEDNDPNPCEGHGSHVSGIAGAVGNNEIGVVGVNWLVSIVPLKVTPDAFCGNFPRSAVIAAIDYATENGIRVTNNSYSFSDPSDAEEEAISLNVSRIDGLFVAAAGNDHRNTDLVGHYPAAYPGEGIISVAATTNRDKIASFSNFGPESVDLGAPGDGVLSTVPGEGYSELSGTSMSSPLVAGAVAFLMAYDQNLSGAAIKEILLNTVDPLEDLDRKTVSGGRLNLDKAFARILKDQPTVSAQTLHFGNVWVGKNQKAAFSVINTTNQAVVANLSVNNARFTLDRTSFDVAPTSHETIEVTFQAQSLGVQNGTITAQIGSFTYTISLTGTGIAPPEIEVTPASLEASTPAGTAKTKMLTLRNKGAATLVYRTFVDPESNALTNQTRGGPDAFGHLWKDSNDASGPAFSWVDITTSGENVVLSNDSYSRDYEIGFDFFFYGSRYTRFYITSNGFIGFSPDYGYIYGTGGAIPNIEEPNNIIAPLWTDLNPDLGGRILYHSDETQLEVAYHDVPLMDGSGSVTFEVILFPDGQMLMQYQNVSNVSTYTIGIENAYGTDGLQIVRNEPYVMNQLAILMTPELSWIRLTPPLTGSLEPGASVDLDLLFSAQMFSEGVYETNLAVVSNDPNRTKVLIPLTFTVTPNALPIADAGTDIEIIDEDNDGTESVQLDASASFDPDGTIISWVWEENGEIIARGEQAFVDLETGFHRITLIVTDHVGAVGYDEVTVNVNEPDICGIVPSDDPGHHIAKMILLGWVVFFISRCCKTQSFSTGI